MSIRPPSRRFSGVPEAKAPKAWRDWLEAGDIGRLLRQAGKQLPASAKRKKSMLQQLRYFENNAPQMRYAEYREKEFFVGSGVVEAGCRTVRECNNAGQ